METRLAQWLQGTATGHDADRILRACVHCGFCLATCPTYQLLGDELDGPRGRIYQIKQVLEGAEPTRETQMHLDRCLTCRGCETTCPSGVEYGQLVDIGRAAVDARVQRPLRERLWRLILREGLSRRRLFGPALRIGRAVSRALPASLRAKMGTRRPAGAWPQQTHARKVLLLNGCTQPAMLPSIDAATARVLDAVGIQAVVAQGSGCCGAIRQHLGDQRGARANFRRNIDAWWPYIESGTVEAVLMNASGCGTMVKEYARLLRDEPEYADRARRLVAMTFDLAEFLPRELAAMLEGAALAPGSRTSPPRARASFHGPSAKAGGAIPSPAQRIAFHPPCTLQHGQKIRAEVEKLLIAFGAQLVPVEDAHLCCGSAGTYSLLQPELATALRARKLEQLLRSRPHAVLSANIGCIAHLQAATDTPVRHWIEWIDEVLTTREVVP